VAFSFCTSFAFVVCGGQTNLRAWFAEVSMDPVAVPHRSQRFVMFLIGRPMTS
jgi:hypothetical protein